MNDLALSSTTLATFGAASLALSIVPGPCVVYIVTRTLARGRGAGLASVAGVALGNFGNLIGAAIGLAALFALSSFAFTAVKIAGALYLVWLGVKTLHTDDAPTPSASGDNAFDAPRVFADGFIVALLNPKTALFFAAFLPQFIDPTRTAIGQSLALGSLFVAIAATTDAAYVIAAGVAAPALARLNHGRGRGVARYLTATIYFALAAAAVAVGSRAAPKG